MINTTRFAAIGPQFRTTELSRDVYVALCRRGYRRIQRSRGDEHGIGKFRVIVPKQHRTAARAEKSKRKRRRLISLNSGRSLRELKVAS